MKLTREIGGKTEKFWCPIKHSMHMRNSHNYYSEFSEYGNNKDFRKKLDERINFNDKK